MGFYLKEQQKRSQSNGFTEIKGLALAKIPY